MRIIVRVNPNAKTEIVEQTGEREYKVSFKVKPVKGEANKKAREMLCKYFDLPKHSVILVGGKTSRNKVFEIKE